MKYTEYDRNSSLWKRIYAEICRTRVIDCHSHLINWDEYEQQERRPGLFDMLGYFGGDIGAMARMGLVDIPDDGTDEARWAGLKEALRRGANTSYCRHVWQILRGLFDLGDTELGDDNWRAIHERIQEASREPDRYRRLLKDVAKIDLSIHNTGLFAAPSGCVPGLTFARKLDDGYRAASVGVIDLIMLGSSDPLQKVAAETDVDIVDAATLTEALREFLRIVKAEGAVAIKSQHAYSRTLRHERVSAEVATGVLSKLMGGVEPDPAELARLQDFIFWQLADHAGQTGLVFQLHTGMQTTLCHMPYSDPRLLLEPIRELQHTRFDLFHAGYPFTIELGVIAKHYPNVWANMAWMYVISMEGSRRTLDEWIDLVPGYRILGFGSDVGWPEMAVAHLSMARLCIADVLAKKVALDMLSEEVAMRLVHQILRENAVELYGLDLR